ICCLVMNNGLYYQKIGYVLPIDCVQSYNNSNDKQGADGKFGVGFEHPCINFKPFGFDATIGFVETDDNHPDNADQEYETHTIDKGNFVNAVDRNGKSHWV